MVFTSENFEAEVLKSDLPVLVDFYADWCGPCKMLSPSVEAMESVFEGKVKIGKLNVDDNSDIAEQYNVMSIPTLIFFKNGQPVETSVGMISKAALQAKLEALA
ncbi:MAG: thioredoxin [Lachnospiraceae bacterium]|nr:thioredoxin [Blautia sp.]MBQ9612674.1 thioredoxin [Lachnospiraceae bacterium]